MLIIFNAKKYVNYTESYSIFWGMNHGEERFLKMLKAVPYIILKLTLWLFEDSCLCTNEEKLFQELYTVKIILKKRVRDLELIYGTISERKQKFT